MGPHVGTQDFRWQRFKSIPSSLFFVLINLNKEQPLADVHKGLCQRILVVATVVLAVPVFALATSVVGLVLQKQTQEEFRRETLRVQVSDIQDPMLIKANG